MNPIERAAALRQEAGSCYGSCACYEIVSEYGTLTPTGSYFFGRNGLSGH